MAICTAAFIQPGDTVELAGRTVLVTQVGRPYTDDRGAVRMSLVGHDAAHRGVAIPGVLRRSVLEVAS